MNHRDIPGWVSEATAVWSWINRGPLKQCSLNTGQVTARQLALGRIKMGANIFFFSPNLIVKKLPAVVVPKPF